MPAWYGNPPWWDSGTACTNTIWGNGGTGGNYLTWTSTTSAATTSVYPIFITNPTTSATANIICTSSPWANIAIPAALPLGNSIQIANPHMVDPRAMTQQIIDDVDLARQAQRVAERQQQRTLAAQPKSAHERAYELLLANLTPLQREMLNKHGFFMVEGGKSKQVYRIRKHTLVGNVDVMNGEKVSHRLCGHCDPGSIPLPDSLLAQKLMLEGDEERFLKIANRHAA